MSTPAAASSASQLPRMPKQPVSDITTSVAAQAKTLFFTTLGVLVLSGALYAYSTVVAENRRAWEAAGLMTAAFFGPGLLLVAFFMGLWAYVQRKKRAELAQGNYYVHWTYDQQQWQEHCQQSEQKLRWLVHIMTGAFFLFGLFLAVMIHFDSGDLIAGSIPTHYAVMILGGTMLGFVIGVYCKYLANITDHLRRTRTPQAVIGPTGVYITGQFAPMFTVGHKFHRVTLNKTTYSSVDFTFLVRNKHGWNESIISIPIPPANNPPPNR